MPRVNELAVGKALANVRSQAPTQFARAARRNATVIVTAALVIGLSMFVVRGGNVGDFERTIFNALNGLPDALRAPMWVLQIFGSLAFVVLLSLAALAAGRTRLGGALAVGVPLKLAIEWWVIKAVVERERPFATVPDAIIRDVNTSPLGFPSGHAILALALAGLLAPYLNWRGKVVVYTLAVLNCVARVYLGAHNPLDVVAGAAVGTLIAAALNLVFGVPHRAIEVDKGNLQQPTSSRQA